MSVFQDLTLGRITQQFGLNLRVGVVNVVHNVTYSNGGKIATAAT